MTTPIGINEIRRVEIGPPKAAHRTIAICDTQPVTAEGIRTILTGTDDLRFGGSGDALPSTAEWNRDHGDVLILDKGFGIQAVLDWLGEWRASAAYSAQVGIIVWGVSITEAEALRFVQAGARGILRKTASVGAVLSCLRAVAEGRSWMEDCVFRDQVHQDRYPRSELTMREQQVLELVEQGYKNKDIATDLGIRPGTVKIHLKHIFEKTGVRGRYGLALSGLRERGALSLTA